VEGSGAGKQLTSQPNSFSNIPVRQKAKQQLKQASLDSDEHQQQSIILTSKMSNKANKNAAHRNSFDSTPEKTSLNTKSAPNSASSNKFRSKLPVKK
jgi:hypothetical protein